MSKTLLAATVLMVCGSPLVAQQPLKKYVETLTIGEFMKLPFDFQVMYLAGITDGFTYVMRNYNVADYEEFSACVRRVSLKVATEEMVEQIKQRKEEEPLTTYFAKSLGARCHRK